MKRNTVLFVFPLALSTVFCASIHKQESLKSQLSESNAPLILGEGVVSAQLNLKPNAESYRALNENKAIQTSLEESNSEIGKSENDPVDFGNEEYIGELPNSQYPHSDELPELLNVDNKRASVRVPSNSPVTVASANPIYITIPIYLNKGEGQPLRLSVGGKEIPLTPKMVGNSRITEPLSPTSQFNRLLKQSETSSNKYKKSNRKSSKKNKRKHKNIRKNSGNSRSTDRHLHSYRFYF